MENIEVSVILADTAQFRFSGNGLSECVRAIEVGEGFA